ncbi:hypothetical protein SAMN05444161_3173 [Rhizobiales bacterium GAS191]|nr:hypothetical protein SAMN05444161_3173 [Rhizobiales bacterium GAS191]
MPRCFVMQPFDGDEFDKRYNEIYRSAIAEAGFEPYRVDRDPSASIPIANIESGIRESAACFADISIDNPNVWFELGYAICANKPICIVCSHERAKFPFDVQHRQIIRYKKGSPSDFEDLRRSIVERLKAIEKKDVDLEPILKQETPEERGNVSDLEFSALCIVFENQESDQDTVSFYAIANSMERAGYTKIASRVSLSSLVRKGMIASSTEANRDDEGSYYVYQVMPQGADVVMNSLEKISLKKAQRLSPMDRKPTAKYAGELDDDTPF